MTPRQRRIADLKAARARIDAELARFGIDLEELDTDQPAPRGTIAAAADLARRLVWSGYTHAETARELGIHPDAVSGLIARGRVA